MLNTNGRPVTAVLLILPAVFMLAHSELILNTNNDKGIYTTLLRKLEFCTLGNEFHLEGIKGKPCAKAYVSKPDDASSNPLPPTGDVFSMYEIPYDESNARLYRLVVKLDRFKVYPKFISITAFSGSHHYIGEYLSSAGPSCPPPDKANPAWLKGGPRNEGCTVSYTETSNKELITDSRAEIAKFILEPEQPTQADMKTKLGEKDLFHVNVKFSLENLIVLGLQQNGRFEPERNQFIFILFVQEGDAPGQEGTCYANLLSPIFSLKSGPQSRSVDCRSPKQSSPNVELANNVDPYAPDRRPKIAVSDPLPMFPLMPRLLIAENPAPSPITPPTPPTKVDLTDKPKDKPLPPEPVKVDPQKIEAEREVCRHKTDLLTNFPDPKCTLCYPNDGYPEYKPRFRTIFYKTNQELESYRLVIALYPTRSRQIKFLGISALSASRHYVGGFNLFEPCTTTSSKYYVTNGGACKGQPSTASRESVDGQDVANMGDTGELMMFKALKKVAGEPNYSGSNELRLNVVFRPNDQIILGKKRDGSYDPERNKFVFIISMQEWDSETSVPGRCFFNHRSTIYSLGDYPVTACKDDKDKKATDITEKDLKGQKSFDKDGNPIISAFHKAAVTPTTTTTTTTTTTPTTTKTTTPTTTKTTTPTTTKTTTPTTTKTTTPTTTKTATPTTTKTTTPTTTKTTTPTATKTTTPTTTKTTTPTTSKTITPTTSQTTTPTTTKTTTKTTTPTTTETTTPTTTTTSTTSTTQQASPQPGKPLPFPTIETIIKDPNALIPPYVPPKETAYAPPSDAAAQADSKKKELSMASIFHGCGKRKGCVGEPPGCIETRSCSSVMTYGDEDYKVRFEIMGKAMKYVAMGLSFDRAMGNDSVVECVREYRTQINAYMSWNFPNRKNSREEDHSAISDARGVYKDGYIICEFWRTRRTVNHGIVFDLGRTNFYILHARGNTAGDGQQGNIGYHGEGSSASSRPYNMHDRFRKTKLTIVMETIHGATMLFAWFFCFPLSAFMARYFKETFKEWSIRGYTIWYAWHVIIAWVGLLCVLIGAIAMFAGIGLVTKFKGSEWNFHSISGLILVAMMFIEPISGYAVKVINRRKSCQVMNYVHGVVGHLSFQLAFLNIYFTTALEGGLPCVTSGLIVTWMVFYVLLHMFMSYMVCYVDFIQGERVSRAYNCFLLRTAPHPLYEDVTGSPARKMFLGAFVLCFSVITAVLMLLYLFSTEDCVEEKDILRH